MIYKKCPNPSGNENCQLEFRYSKSGLCRSCSAKKSYNDIRSGRTYEEIYGVELANDMKERASIRMKQWMEGVDYSGEINPNYGNTNRWKGMKWDEIYGNEKSKELKRLQSIRASGTGSVFYGMDQSGTNNAHVQYKINQIGISEDEYEKILGRWFIYKRDVWRITNKQDIHLLENFDRRGKSGEDNKYHLDHIISMKYGFD